MAPRPKNKKPPAAPRTLQDARAGIEPSTRVFTTWTPALIRSAEIQADSGNLRAAANLTDWILSDDRVQSTTDTRTQALLGLLPTFEASGDKRRSNRAVKALDAQEDWWASYPEAELGLLLTWGYMLGVAPARHNWRADEDHGGRVLPCPEFWHPQHLRQDSLTRAWLIRTATSGNGFSVGAEDELEPGGGTWLLHCPYGKNRPWSRGLWRGLSRFVLLKYLATGDWARHSEKGALLVAEQDVVDDTTITSTVRQSLAEDIYSRGRDGVCILPPGFSLKLVEATANTKDIYEAQMTFANTAIAIAIRGGNLTTETAKSGSRAVAQVQANLGEQGRLTFDAQALTTTIHDQSLVWWAEYNYGDRKLAPWPVYPTAPKRDTRAKAETANAALDVVAKAEDRGFDVDRQKFAEEFELTDWLKPGTKKAPPVVPAIKEPDEKEPTDPDDAGADDDAHEDPDEPGAGAKAHGGFIAMLASGGTVAEAPGFIAGQTYADQLTEAHTAAALVALKTTQDAVLDVLTQATSYDDLRERLRAKYRDMDGDELTRLVESALQLGDLAGRLAVQEDVLR